MAFLYSLFFTFLLSPQPQNQEYQLKVVFEGIEKTQGNLMIRVRNAAQHELALKVHPVQSKIERLSFKLPAGNYAVDVYHDENANQELDKNLVGMPTEKYGFSNNPSATFGPPAFKEQLVKLDKDRTIEIKLQ